MSPTTNDLIDKEGTPRSAESTSQASDVDKPKFSDDSALSAVMAAAAARREERRLKKSFTTTTGSTFKGHDPSLIRFETWPELTHVDYNSKGLFFQI